MSTLEAIILGILQGLAEFLPISSSGHLQLGQYFLGLTNLDQFIMFNLVCHLGTLLALVIIFREQILTAFFDRTRFLQVLVATLPLFPLLLILKPIKAMFNQPEYLGWCYLLTALLLYLGINVRVSGYSEGKIRRWRDPFIIGCFQAMAILPGVSRSGSTLSAGRMLGWPKEDAITFAFLLAIPTILGGVALEILHLYKGTVVAPNICLQPYVAGFLTSFVVGYFSLKLLMRLAAKDKFIYFVWYCAALGIGLLFYFK